MEKILNDIQKDLEDAFKNIKNFGDLAPSNIWMTKKTATMIKEHRVPPHVPRMVDHYTRPRFMPRWKWYFLRWFDDFKQELATMKWRQGGKPNHGILYMPGFFINSTVARLLETACEPMYHGPGERKGNEK